MRADRHGRHAARRHRGGARRESPVSAVRSAARFARRDDRRNRRRRRQRTAALPLRRRSRLRDRRESHRRRGAVDSKRREGREERRRISSCITQWSEARARSALCPRSRSRCFLDRRRARPSRWTAARRRGRRRPRERSNRSGSISKPSISWRWDAVDSTGRSAAAIGARASGIAESSAAACWMTPKSRRVGACSRLRLGDSRVSRCQDSVERTFRAQRPYRGDATGFRPSRRLAASCSGSGNLRRAAVPSLRSRTRQRSNRPDGGTTAGRHRQRVRRRHDHRGRRAQCIRGTRAARARSAQQVPCSIRSRLASSARTARDGARGHDVRALRILSRRVSHLSGAGRRDGFAARPNRADETGARRRARDGSGAAVHRPMPGMPRL